MTQEFHAHVYFDPATRDVAASIRASLAARFPVDTRWRDEPIGPHAKPNVRVRFAAREFGEVVQWLMQHREGLSVLVHPYTPEHVRDHTDRALWLGERLPLDLEFLRRHEAEQAARVDSPACPYVPTFPPSSR